MRSLLLADAAVQGKVDYARQFAAQKVICNDLVYTTETDLMEQESNAIAKLTAVQVIAFFDMVKALTLKEIIFGLCRQVLDDYCSHKSF